MKKCANPGGPTLCSNSLITSEFWQLISVILSEIKFLSYGIDPLSFLTEGDFASLGEFGNVWTHI